MTQFFKTISDYEIALDNDEVENKNKIEIVLHASEKLTSVMVPALSKAKLHTTTSRFIERKHKLQDALFFSLQRVLEVKSYPHYLKRDDLIVLRNTKVSNEEINKILDVFDTGLVIKHGILTNEISKLEELLNQKDEPSKQEIKDLNEKKQEKILISQVQETIGTYLSIVENNTLVD